MPTGISMDELRQQAEQKQEEKRKREERERQDQQEKQAMREERARMKKKDPFTGSGNATDPSQGVDLSEIGKWVDREKAGKKLSKKQPTKGELVDRSLGKAIGAHARATGEAVSDIPEMVGDAYEAAYLNTGKRLASATADLGPMIGLDIDPDTRKSLAGISRTLDDMQRAAAPMTNKGMEEDAFRWAFENVARATPDLALGTLFSVATTPAGGAAYFGAVQKADVYDETLQSMQSKGHSIEESATAARRASNVSGAITAVTSLVPAKAIAGRALPAAAQKKIAGGMVGKAYASRAGQYAETMGAEAVQEGIESIGTDLSRAHFEGDKSIMEGAGGRVKESMAAGAMFGGVMESMGKAVSGANAMQARYENTLAKRGMNAAAEAARIAGSDGGMDKLRALGSVKKPTRKDFIEAGFDPNIRLNKKQRQQVAELFEPERLDTGKRLMEEMQQQQAEAARQQGEGAPAEGGAGEPMMSTGQPAAPEALTEEAGSADLNKIGEAISEIFSSKSGIGQIIAQRFDSPVARKGKELFKKGFASTFLSRGMLNDPEFQTIIQREFDMKAEAKQTEFALKDFNDGLKSEYGSTEFDKLPEMDRQRLRDAIAGDSDAMNKLSDSVRTPLKKMRGRIDQLSQELVDSGAIEGDLAVLMGDQFMDTMFEKAGVPNPERRKINKPDGKILGGQGWDTKVEALAGIRKALKEGEPHAKEQSIEFLEKAGVKKDAAQTIVEIISNDGIYLHRSYRAFDDPEWAHKVDPAVRNRAKAWLRKEHKGISEDKAEQMIREMLFDAAESQNPISFMAKQVNAGRAALKHRKELSHEIRELFGQYEDPGMNFAKTVRNLSSMVSNNKMLNELRTIGIEDGFLSHTEGDNPNHIVEFKPEGGKAYAPLAGMRTTPEIKKAIDGHIQGMEGLNWDNPIYNAYQKLEGFSQRAKTSLSTTAMLRQVPSNMLIAMANGHNPAAFTKHIGDMLQDSLKMPEGEWRGRIVDGVQHGVIGENVEMNVIAEKQGRKVMMEAFEDMTRLTPGNKWNPYTYIKKLGITMDQLYSGMDTMFKMAAWEIETARYAEARGIDMSDPSSPEVAKLKKEMARIVRDTNPTYSLIPLTWREGKKLPILSFISFQTEVIRNTANQFMLASKEMRDPELRGIGMKRMLGFLTAKSMVPAVTAAAGFLTGFGSEDEDAVRELANDYHKNTQLVPVSRAGKLTKFMDAGYIDPVGFAHKSMNAMLRGANPWEQGYGALTEFIQPYTSSKLVNKYAREAMAGYTEYGTELYGETDNDAEKWLKGAAHVVNNAMMPGTLQTAHRVYKAGMDIRTGGNTKLDLANEMMASVGGARTFTIDAESKLERNAYKFKGDTNNITSNFRKVLNREGRVTMGEYERAYSKMRQERQEVYETLQRKISASQQLYKEIDVEATLKGAGLSDDAAREISDDVYKSWVPSTLEHMDKMLEFATPEDAVLIQEAREEKLESLVYSATGPALSEGSAEKAQASIEVLEKRGVSKEETFEHLVSSFHKADIREKMRELKKLAKKNSLSLTDDELEDLAKEEVQSPTWSAARRSRVNRINWHRE